MPSDQFRLTKSRAAVLQVSVLMVALVGGLSTVILFLVFPWSGFYQPTMYGLIIIIGTLVGMEISPC